MAYELNPNSKVFSFFKGSEDIVRPKEGTPFQWQEAANLVREHLGDAMNARNVAFLFGSGCSSAWEEDQEVGIPTMAPMAKAFLKHEGELDENLYLSQDERDVLNAKLGIDVSSKQFANNLERLMEYLHSAHFILKDSTDEELKKVAVVVSSAIEKLTQHVLTLCSTGPFSDGNDTVLDRYQAFYQKLVFRDRALPRPWVFTTNYDLFNETAMDRRGIPYCNGFSGTVERRFNPTVFRYSLAEQLDITSRKWTAVDSFVYLCKLHGSINWMEDGKTLYPVREVQFDKIDKSDRVLIYPTPAKQNASLAAPYSDLFREFQARVVRDQSVLITVGYSFGDEHINNIIFQALTIPNFRLVALLPPDAEGVPKALRALGDPRIWLIGGEGEEDGRKAHYFDTFVESFMPEPPGSKIDTAVSKVLEELIVKKQDQLDGDKNGL